MPTFDKKIVIYLEDKKKKEYQKFCKINFPTLSDSQVGYFAIQRFMDDHDPDTFRGKMNDLVGALGQDFFIKKYGRGGESRKGKG